MIMYSKKVDLRSRKEMIDFLTGHFRYNTMNSWNQSTSYAHNVKVYNLGLTSEQETKLYEMINVVEFYERIDMLLDEFAFKHDYFWQVRFNGRSNGYLVLYQGFKKISQCKSICTVCGQENFNTIEKSGHNKCMRCGANARINLSEPPSEVRYYSAKPTDMCEDFECWKTDKLRDRVKLICEFDVLCDNILTEVIDLLDKFEVEEEVVVRTHTRKVLKEVAS